MSGAAQPAAISPRFSSASTVTANAPSLSSERVAEISAKHERVTERAESHFEKNRQKWTNRQYGELLSRDGERMTLRPAGMQDDRKAHLMRAADYMVRQKQANRIAKIERAANNMLRGNRGKQYEIGR